jgi:hypothetical protein
VSEPRAADDFEVIRERLEELRREREENAPKGSGDAPGSEGGDDAAEDDDERRRRDRVEGLPPPWVPTIFLPQPTD